MKLKKQKLGMEAGVRYRGYGFINEFGEFEFTPEATGSRQGSVKVLKQGENFTISYTSKSVIIHGRLERSLDTLTRIKKLSAMFNLIFEVVRDYDL
ncbi:MAG: hypothetical protein U0L77_05385 [Prevotellamassilia sp.]|nr:hypothetical protein [Prevotellamassilia sp.]